MEITLGRIAEVVGGTVLGDEEFAVTGISSLESALPSEISFFADRRYKEGLNNTKAGAIVVSRETPSFKGPQVVVSHVELAYARVATLFSLPVPRYPGISEDAFIHEKCIVGKDVSIYPMVAWFLLSSPTPMSWTVF